MPDTTPARPETFTLAVDQTSTLLALLDHDGRLTFANACALEMIGAAADDVVGEPFWETPWWRHDAAGRTQLRLAVAEAVRTGVHATRFDTLLLSSSGEPRRVDFKLTPLREDDGSVVALLAEGHDVTERWRAEHALRQTQAHVEGLLEAVPDAVVAIDDMKRVVVFNRGAERAFGWTAAEIAGQPLDVLLPTYVRRAHDAHVARFAAEAAGGPAHGRRSTRTLTARRRDGTLFPVDASLATFLLGTQRIYCAVLRDITEQRAAEQALAEARRRTELILATAAEGIVGVDAEGLVTFVNEAVAAQLERPVGSTIGRPLGDVLHGHPHQGTGDECPTITAIGTGVPCEGEDTYRRADGSTFPVEFSVRPLVVDAAHAGAVLSFRDVTERKAVESQLLALSLLDELTSLQNRRGFVTLAEQELALARRAGLPVVLAYVDVDRFKHINDTFGHSAGDAALRHLADALRRTLRESDVVGRVGGDEFVVLAPATGYVGSPDAMAGAWRVRLDRALAEHPGRVVYGGAPLSVSAGWVVSTPGDERSLEALMAEADAALYARKRGL